MTREPPRLRPELGLPSPRRRRRASDGLQTEYAFVLPRGYVDASGTVHRDGVMRLATARDEIIPQRDPRVRENEAYLTVLLLSRVVTRLGTLTQVHTGRHRGPVRVRPRVPAGPLPPHQPGGPHPGVGHLPACNHEFTVDVAGEQRLGES